VHSLLPNAWQNPFPDKNTYLETHYRLQREEAISMLRYSVKKYREDTSMIDDDETCVYTRVRLLPQAKFGLQPSDIAKYRFLFKDTY
jgi:hypothetical protein